jgi:hypothetical protein
VQMLHEVIPAVERPLRFWLVPTLLVFVSSHVRIVGMRRPAERTSIEDSALCIAADPCCPKSVHRILVSDPLVLGFECCSR